MPKFSSTSAQRLATCHEDLQLLFNEVIKHIDCTIICGHRGEAEQNQAFAEGRSKLKWPYGNHNATPSHAVDAMPYPIEWNNRERTIYFAGTVMGIADKMYADGKISHKIRWGGDWAMKDLTEKNKFDDLDHFEIII